MAEPNVENSPRRRRLRMLLALTRAVLAGVGLVAAYYLIPMDRPFTVNTLLGLVGGLVLVVGLLVVQTLQITRSAYPQARAVEAVTTVFSLFILLFASSYFLMERNATAFNQGLTRTDALYFTITTFATVGYGDVVPVTSEARIMAMVQILGDLLLVGVVLKIILGAVQTGLRRGGRGNPAPHGRDAKE